MKARIKKTGELVNIASYAKITLESYDSWGNPIEVSPEEIELVYDDGNPSFSPDHWQEQDRNCRDVPRHNIRPDNA